MNACKHGHIGAGRTRSGRCRECVRLRNARYAPVLAERWRNDPEFRANRLAYAKAQRDEKRLKADINAWARDRVNGLRNRAEAKHVPFDLTCSDLLAIIPSDMKCPVLGIDMEFGKRRAAPNNLSVDRLIPELGYVKGNIAIISNRANTIKQDATAKELRKVADWIERETADRKLNSCEATTLSGEARVEQVNAVNLPTGIEFHLEETINE